MAEKPGPSPEDRAPDIEYYLEKARELVSKRYPGLSSKESEDKVTEVAKAMADFENARDQFYLGGFSGNDN